MENKLVETREFGVIIVESVNSNYRGDIDADNSPTTTSDGKGIIPYPCTKSKQRFLVADHQGLVWQEIAEMCNIHKDDYGCYFVLESPNRGFEGTPQECNDQLIESKKKAGEEAIIRRCWDMKV
jgi:hypothetical protein